MNSVTPGWLLSQSLTIGFRPSRGRRPGTWCGLGRLAQLMVRSACGACFLVEEVIVMCMSHLDSVGPRFLFFAEDRGIEPHRFHSATGFQDRLHTVVHIFQKT